MRILLFVFTLMSVGSIYPQSDTAFVEKYFQNHAGAFVLFDMSSGKYFRYNKQRCAERFTPASTFKIPNSLVGLETKVIPDENFVIKWDGIERPVKEWNRDHTLASAIKYSVVPYYQELARRVGKERMQKYLDEFDYGNQKIGERIDYFWLDNSLKISADEQIEFLKKFYGYKLPVSKRSIDIVKKILPKEEFSKSVLRVKTGGGEKEDGTYIGWLVGYVEKGNNVYLFAFNVDGKSFDEVRNLRDTAPKEILKYLKVIE